ncbi:hypothetical protein BJ742DRAFT_837888 [Cladochytrium replicatum]|nr:hypothetical protein BJ742DRAFT_837888 [Cladochytrium replicatum]
MAHHQRDSLYGSLLHREIDLLSHRRLKRDADHLLVAHRRSEQDRANLSLVVAALKKENRILNDRIAHLFSANDSHSNTATQTTTQDDWLAHIFTTPTTRTSAAILPSSPAAAHKNHRAKPRHSSTEMTEAAPQNKKENNNGWNTTLSLHPDNHTTANAWNSPTPDITPTAAWNTSSDSHSSTWGTSNNSNNKTWNTPQTQWNTTPTPHKAEACTPWNVEGANNSNNKTWNTPQTQWNTTPTPHKAEACTPWNVGGANSSNAAPWTLDAPPEVELKIDDEWESVEETPVRSRGLVWSAQAGTLWACKRKEDGGSCGVTVRVESGWGAGNKDLEHDEEQEDEEKEGDEEGEEVEDEEVEEDVRKEVRKFWDEDEEREDDGEEEEDAEVRKFWEGGFGGVETPTGGGDTDDAPDKPRSRKGSRAALITEDTDDPPDCATRRCGENNQHILLSNAEITVAKLNTQLLAARSEAEEMRGRLESLETQLGAVQAECAGWRRRAEDAESKISRARADDDAAAARVAAAAAAAAEVEAGAMRRRPASAVESSVSVMRSQVGHLKARDAFISKTLAETMAMVAEHKEKQQRCERKEVAVQVEQVARREAWVQVGEEYREEERRSERPVSDASDGTLRPESGDVGTMVSMLRRMEAESASGVVQLRRAHSDVEKRRETTVRGMRGELVGAGEFRALEERVRELEVMVGGGREEENGPPEYAGARAGEGEVQGLPPPGMARGGGSVVVILERSVVERGPNPRCAISDDGDEGARPSIVVVGFGGGVGAGKKAGSPLFLRKAAVGAKVFRKDVWGGDGKENKGTLFWRLGGGRRGTQGGEDQVEE